MSDNVREMRQMPRMWRMRRWVWGIVSRRKKSEESARILAVKISQACDDRSMRRHRKYLTLETRSRTHSQRRQRRISDQNVKCISRSTHMQPKPQNPQSLWPALAFRASSQPSTDWWPATWLAVAFDFLWCYGRSLSRLSGSSRRRSAMKLNNCSLLETQNLRKKKIIQTQMLSAIAKKREFDKIRNFSWVKLRVI